MKIIIYFIFLSASLLGITQVKAVKNDSLILKAKTIYGADTFETLYYSTKDDTFCKKTKDTIVTYSNFQLGEITSANTFNPLRINLFYRDFNTVIILDNRLAEVFKVDFNTIQPYKNVTFVSTGFDNTLWIFNQDLQQLELFDFITTLINVKTVPIQSRVLDMKSDYNFCFLLTEDYLYVYNYFGSLVNKFKNEGFTKMAFSKANVVLKKGNKLHILPKKISEIKPIETPGLLINQFLVTNQTLYLYNDNNLLTYQLKN